jgi:hypothetical protein
MAGDTAQCSQAPKAPAAVPSMMASLTRGRPTAHEEPAERQRGSSSAVGRSPDREAMTGGTADFLKQSNPRPRYRR